MWKWFITRTQDLLGQKHGRNQTMTFEEKQAVVVYLYSKVSHTILKKRCHKGLFVIRVEQENSSII